LEREDVNVNMNKKCKIEGCDNEVKAKDLCNMHYSRKRRTGTLETKTIERGKIKKCIAFDCNKPHFALGYCKNHYFINNATGSPYSPKIIKLCSICDNPHQAKGLCIKHYREWQSILKENGLKE
jgi:hypothetical protein